MILSGCHIQTSGIPIGLRGPELPGGKSVVEAGHGWVSEATQPGKGPHDVRHGAGPRGLEVAWLGDVLAGARGTPVLVGGGGSNRRMHKKPPKQKCPKVSAPGGGKLDLKQ